MAQLLDHRLFFRDPRFSLQHPQGSLQPSVTPIAGDLMPFSGFLVHCIYVVHRHTYRKTKQNETKETYTKKTPINTRSVTQEWPIPVKTRFPTLFIVYASEKHSRAGVSNDEILASVIILLLNDSSLDN